MRVVFADTFYWQALAHPKDVWHEPVRTLSRQLSPFRIVTTDEVLAEFLTAFAGRGGFWREKAVALARRILDNPNVVVVAQSRRSFLAGLDLYASRADKRYTFVDCVSMATMRERALEGVLTNDRHFVQEGFTILLANGR